MHTTFLPLPLRSSKAHHFPISPNFLLLFGLFGSQPFRALFSASNGIWYYSTLRLFLLILGCDPILNCLPLVILYYLFY